MTISAQTAVIRVQGNDVVSAFPFVFPWTSPSDVHVALMAISTGAIEPLILDTHYNLSTVGNEHLVGGSITTIDDEGDPLAVPNTKLLVAWLQPTLIQNLAYPASSAAKEAALDRVYKSLQYFEWQRGRSLRLADEHAPPASARGLELPSVGHRASRVLGFDVDGNVQMVDGPGGSVVGGDVIAYAAEVAGAGGAGLVGITDAGGHYDGSTVEGALQEAGADLAAHLMDTAGAHAAAAISVADGGGLFTAEDVEAALAELRTLVNALEAAVVLKGTWDASAGTFPGAGVAQAGWSYIVSVGGTVNGQVFVANDRIVAIADNASTSTYAANWHKLDYTDQVLSVAGKTGAVALTAADIGLVDSGGNFTATDVEGALAELATGGGGGVGQNALINGSMRVAQRGTSFTSTGGANNDDVYVLDRWNLLSDGNDIVDVSQATDAPAGAMFSMGLDVETVDKKFGVLQIIEQKNCPDLIGQTVVLSAYLKVTNAARLDKIKMAIVAWDGTADAVTSDIISAWGADGANPTLVANWTYENTPADLGVTTSWARYSVSAAVDTASAKNIGVFIWSDNVTDTDLGDFLYVANVKLELGSSPTAFQTPTVTEDLALCQRYFIKLTPDTAPARFAVGTWATGGAGGNVQFGVPLPSQMRALPTGTFNDMTTVDTAGIHVTTSMAVQYAAGPVVGFSLTSSATGGTGNAPAQIRFASTASYLQFAAEL